MVWPLDRWRGLIHAGFLLGALLAANALAGGDRGRVVPPLEPTPSPAAAAGVQATDTPWPTYVMQKGPPPIGEPVSTDWATGHVSTEEIVDLLNAAGITARVSPPPPAKALLFNASDLDLVSVDLPTVRGFVVYRYPDAASARRAFGLRIVSDPSSGTIDWVARPHFVLVGDALVSFATDYQDIAGRVFDALLAPRAVLSVEPLGVGATTVPGFTRLPVRVLGTPSGHAAVLAGQTIELTATPATTYTLTAGEVGRAATLDEMRPLLESGQTMVVTIVFVRITDGVFRLVGFTNVSR